MREIKFRAYVLGKMYEVRDMTWDNGDLTIFTDGGWMSLPDDNASLMQYTGLKDKNGKKIYEGDILLQKDAAVWEEYIKDDGTKWSRQTKQKQDYKYCVYFDNRTAQFTTTKNWLWLLGQVAEIIGNIHDNPELKEE